MKKGCRDLDTPTYNYILEGVINFVSLNFSYWDISAHR